MRSIHRPLFGVVIAVCLGIALSACTKAPVLTTTPTQSSSEGTQSSDEATSPAESATSETSTSTTSVAATSSSARPTASASASPIAASTTPGTDPNACRSSELTLTVERGSGVNGHQYAALRFTNSGTRTCTLTGFPSAQLMLAGTPLGKPAVHSNLAPAKVSLAPARSAVAELVNDSTCNADNSDSVQVVAPGTSTAVIQPLARFRGCPMTIDPVSAG